MKIHEYQGKELFKKAGVPTQEGYVAFSTNEAIDAYDKLNSNKVVLKAQIHAGGRGKGGGVKLANNVQEVKTYANEIIGMNLITHRAQFLLGYHVTKCRFLNISLRNILYCIDFLEYIFMDYPQIYQKMEPSA